jgi:hypothetical protein
MGYGWLEMIFGLWTIFVPIATKPWDQVTVEKLVFMGIESIPQRSRTEGLFRCHAVSHVGLRIAIDTMRDSMYIQLNRACCRERHTA